MESRKAPAWSRESLAAALRHAVGHPARVGGLAILAEGEHSVKEIADLLGLEIRIVGNHIRDLCDRGCIEGTRTRTVGNFTQHFYQLAEPPKAKGGRNSVRKAQSRRRALALKVQRILVEILDAFESGMLETDNNLCLRIEVMPLDERARQDVKACLDARQRELRAIHKEAARRLAARSEAGVPTAVATLAFTKTPWARRSEESTPATNKSLERE